MATLSATIQNGLLLQPNGAPDSPLLRHSGAFRAITELLSTIKADPRDSGRCSDWVAAFHAVIRNSYESMSQQPSKNRKDLSSLLAKSEFLSVEQLKEAIKDNTVSLKGSLWSICAYKSVPEKIGNKRAQTPSVLRVFPGKQALTITVGILTVDPGLGLCVKGTSAMIPCEFDRVWDPDWIGCLILLKKWKICLVAGALILQLYDVQPIMRLKMHRPIQLLSPKKAGVASQSDKKMERNIVGSIVWVSDILGYQRKGRQTLQSDFYVVIDRCNHDIPCKGLETENWTPRPGNPCLLRFGPKYQGWHSYMINAEKSANTCILFSNVQIFKLNNLPEFFQVQEHSSIMLLANKDPALSPQKTSIPPRFPFHNRVFSAPFVGVVKSVCAKYILFEKGILLVTSHSPRQLPSSVCPGAICQVCSAWMGTNSIKRNSKAQGDSTDAKTVPPFTMTFFANEFTRIRLAGFATLSLHEPDKTPRWIPMSTVPTDVIGQYEANKRYMAAYQIGNSIGYAMGQDTAARSSFEFLIKDARKQAPEYPLNLSSFRILESLLSSMDSRHQDCDSLETCQHIDLDEKMLCACQAQRGVHIPLRELIANSREIKENLKAHDRLPLICGTVDHILGEFGGLVLRDDTGVVSLNISGVGVTSLVGKRILALDFDLFDGIWAPVIWLNSSMLAFLPGPSRCSTVQDRYLCDMNKTCPTKDEECAWDPLHTYLGIVVALTEKRVSILCSNVAIKRIVSRRVGPQSHTCFYFDTCEDPSNGSTSELRMIDCHRRAVGTILLGTFVAVDINRETVDRAIGSIIKCCHCCEESEAYGSFSGIKRDEHKQLCSTAYIHLAKPDASAAAAAKSGTMRKSQEECFECIAPRVSSDSLESWKRWTYSTDTLNHCFGNDPARVCSTLSKLCTEFSLSIKGIRNVRRGRSEFLPRATRGIVMGVGSSRAGAYSSSTLSVKLKDTEWDDQIEAFIAIRSGSQSPIVNMIKKHQEVLISNATYEKGKVCCLRVPSTGHIEILRDNVASYSPLKICPATRICDIYDESAQVCDERFMSIWCHVVHVRILDVGSGDVEMEFLVEDGTGIARVFLHRKSNAMNIFGSMKSKAYDSLMTAADTEKARIRYYCPHQGARPKISKSAPIRQRGDPTFESVESETAKLLIRLVHAAESSGTLSLLATLKSLNRGERTVYFKNTKSHSDYRTTANQWPVLIGEDLQLPSTRDRIRYGLSRL